MGLLSGHFSPWSPSSELQTVNIESATREFSKFSERLSLLERQCQGRDAREARLGDVILKAAHQRSHLGLKHMGNWLAEKYFDPLKQRLSTIEARDDAQQKLITEIDRKVVKLEEQVSSLQKVTTIDETRVGSLLETTNQEMSDHNHRLNALEEGISNTLKMEKEERLQKEVEELRSQTREMNKEIRSLQHQLKEAREVSNLSKSTRHKQEKPSGSNQKRKVKTEPEAPRKRPKTAETSVTTSSISDTGVAAKLAITPGIARSVPLDDFISLLKRLDFRKPPDFHLLQRHLTNPKVTMFPLFTQKLPTVTVKPEIHYF
ncbi:hypothetical protein QBC38DRAFT_531303 [Podospora fimiseda]|uniref:Uncharacterized protein n=1 Tax=Podospora fimiseda TaxID=252190 RepID=A0AAN7BKX1_9PEZI|nr:hypothetical protein QBC38DRAFT_531303 [Podospora fimiseda]